MHFLDLMDRNEWENFGRRGDFSCRIEIVSSWISICLVESEWSMLLSEQLREVVCISFLCIPKHCLGF